MTILGEGVRVGVLGQWASGKTEAARTLVRHLGGEGEVVFLTDRVLFVRQAVNHLLELGDSVVVVQEEDGRQRLEGKLVTIWLEPGEDLCSVDPGSLQIHFPDGQAHYAWRRQAKAALGREIRERSADGKPLVIEVSFGPNVEPAGEDAYGRTIPDLFARLHEAGVEPWHVNWIIVEAGFHRRSERNRRRPANIPTWYFARYGADGGDLTPECQRRLEAQGTVIQRVPNEHDDVERFRADVLAAFAEMG